MSYAFEILSTFVEEKMDLFSFANVLNKASWIFKKETDLI